MTYYIAGVAALRQEFFHGAKNAAVPFDLGDDAQTVTKIDKEAAKSGIAKRDVLERLNGAPYTGLAQLSDFRAHSKPGDPIRLTFRTPDGRAKNVETPLLPVEGPNFSLGEYFAFLTPVLFVPLLSLIVGYWIVAARPRDPNAWLVLFLLTFPEIGFANLDWKFWGGASSTVLGVWNFTQTYLLQLALLWFGVYFPERWRVDIRWPAVKWTITAVVLAAFSLNLWLAGLQYFDVAALAPLLPLESWTNQVSGWSAILCSALFLAAIFDKLRSASTPDARRRLRILAVGSTISLGGMVLMIGLLPRLGFSPPEWLLLSVDIPVFILFPLTLAYVVVVQRAMDIRILLRMGTKYLIAKATLVVLQIVFVLVLIFGVDIPIVERHVHKTTFVLIAVSVAIVAFLIRRSAAGKKISVGNRLHAWLDRKFFREAYNAEMVLSELSEHARRFTERDPLIETVSRRISEVLHVPLVAVWLRGSNTFHLQQAVGFNRPRPRAASRNILHRAKSRPHQSPRNRVSRPPRRMARGSRARAKDSRSTPSRPSCFCPSPAATASWASSLSVRRNPKSPTPPPTSASCNRLPPKPVSPSKSASSPTPSPPKPPSASASTAKSKSHAKCSSAFSPSSFPKFQASPSPASAAPRSASEAITTI